MIILKRSFRVQVHLYLPALSSAIIFGFSFLLTKNALDFVTPSQLLALRLLVAALIMSILWALEVVRMRLRRHDLKGILLLASRRATNNRL